MRILITPSRTFSALLAFLFSRRLKGQRVERGDVKRTADGCLNAPRPGLLLAPCRKFQVVSPLSRLVEELPGLLPEGYGRPQPGHGLHSLHHLDHGHLVVDARVLQAGGRAAVLLVARLVVVRLGDQDQAWKTEENCSLSLSERSRFHASPTLDGDEQLQHVGLGRPLLGALAAPRAQEADAHLALHVEVGVQTVAAPADVVGFGRRLRED